MKQLTINLKNIQVTPAAQFQKNDPIKTCAKELNRHFSKEDIQMLSKSLQEIIVGEVVEKRELSYTLGRTQQSHY